MSRVSPVALLVILTLARGTTAPVGSTTVPTIEPYRTCAWTGLSSPNTRKASDKVRATLPQVIPHPVSSDRMHLAPVIGSSIFDSNRAYQGFCFRFFPLYKTRPGADGALGLVTLLQRLRQRQPRLLQGPLRPRYHG